MQSSTFIKLQTTFYTYIGMLHAQIKKKKKQYFKTTGSILLIINAFIFLIIINTQIHIWDEERK